MLALATHAMGERDAARVAAFLAELAGMSPPLDKYPPLHAARSDGRLFLEQATLAVTDFLRGRCADQPVVQVSWHDAKAYVEWLSRKTGKPYRLLSESEWEYAARATTQATEYTNYPFGNDPADLCKHGNVADQSTRTIKGTEKKWDPVACSDGFAYTSPVGSFQPNAFGLHDMIGNAWQWVEDCYRSGYDRSPVDGSVWTMKNCNKHINRGGAWSSFAKTARTSTRGQMPPDDQYESVGLRVARNLDR